MRAMAPMVRVALVGVGGTGCVLLPLLAMRPGIALTVIDGDTVEEANLDRQPLYGAMDLGRSKVEAAVDRIRSQWPSLAIAGVGRFLDGSNARTLLSGHDLIVDCTDDLHARVLIDRICGDLDTPLVTGAVHGYQVQVATLRVRRSDGPHSIGREQFFNGPIGAEQDGCDMRRVPAHVTTLAASVMARHIQALLEGDHSLAGVLELIDTKNGRWLSFTTPAAPFDEELIASARLGTDDIP